jgi:excisionase family DNA binding protein
MTVVAFHRMCIGPKSNFHTAHALVRTDHSMVHSKFTLELEGEHALEVKAPKLADGELLTAEELADFLRVHRSTVYRLLRNGQLPAFRVGSDWRFSRDLMRNGYNPRSARRPADELGRAQFPEDQLPRCEKHPQGEDPARLSNIARSHSHFLLTRQASGSGRTPASRLPADPPPYTAPRSSV